MPKGTEIGSAYFKLVPSMDGVEKAVSRGLSGQKVRAAGTSAGGKIGTSVISGIGSKISAGAVAIGNVAASAVTAAAGTVGDYFSQAIDLSDATKKFETSMRFAGFSDADIAAAQEQVKWYADQTVYDLDTIQNTVLQLGANGTDNFVALAYAAGNLNAAAGGTAETFATSVSKALTQTTSLGKLNAENWNQLAEAIPGASGLIKQELLDMGAYTGNWEDALSSGAISAEEFNEAIMHLGLEDVAWEASTSTKTIEGAMGNFDAAVVGAMADVYDAINGDGRVTSAIVALGDSIGGLVSGAAPGIGELATEVEGFVGTVGKFGGAVAEAFGPTVTDAIGQISEAAGNAVDMVENGFGALTSDLPAIGEALEPIGAAFGDLFSDAVTDGAILLSTSMHAIGDLAEPLGTVGAVVSESVAPVLDGLLETLKDSGLSVIESIKGAIETISEALPSLGEGIGFLSTNLGGVFDVAIKDAALALSGAIQGIADVFSIVVDVLTGDWSGAWEGVQTLFADVTTTINDIVDTTFPGLTEGIQGVLDTVGEKVGNVGEFFGDCAETVTTWWDDNISTPFKDGVSDVGTKLNELPGKVSTAVAELPDKMANGLASISAKVESWGIGDKVTAAMDGIGELISGPLSTAKDSAYESLTAINDKFGIFDAMGVDLEATFLGIEGFMSDPIGTAKDTIGGLVGDIQGFFDGIHFEFPDFKMPHIKTDGSGYFNNIFDWHVPEFYVEWYASGGIATGPSVVGVGEAGNEAIVPLEGGYMRPFAEAVATQLDATGARGGVTYNVYIDGAALRADEAALALLREFVAGVVQVNGGRRAFA